MTSNVPTYILRGIMERWREVERDLRRQIEKSHSFTRDSPNEVHA